MISGWGEKGTTAVPQKNHIQIKSATEQETRRQKSPNSVSFCQFRDTELCTKTVGAAQNRRTSRGFAFGEKGFVLSFYSMQIAGKSTSSRSQHVLVAPTDFVIGYSFL